MSLSRGEIRGALNEVSFDQNLNDRKLGHEWYGWDGNIEAHEAFIYEPKRLFMGLLFAAFSLAFGLACLLVWAVYPRLQSIHPRLAMASLVVLAVLTLTFVAWYGVVALVLVTKRPIKLADIVGHQFFRVFPALAVFSQAFGVSKDRLGYSLLEVHNELLRLRLRQASSGRILCLAPRCLERQNVDQIRAIMAEYDCDFYMAPNGAMARQRIVQLKPAAIIGIACERDLVTGIRDVGYEVPVIGIANKRPLGPCKGAFIDMSELREAIEVFKDRYECARAHNASATSAEAE